MNLHKNLSQLGLTPKQATVYLTCLQLGIDTVLHIAKMAGLKRPTVYLLLDELEAMGLVSRVQKEHKTLFKAEDPEIIISRLKLQQEKALSILPSLKAIYNLDPEKPTIKIHEGVLGARNVYTDIFTYFLTHPTEELLIFGSLKDSLEYFETQVVDFFYASIGKTKTHVREIGNDDHETRKYYRASARLNPNHDIRLIRNEGRFSQTDNMLYGNQLAIFSVKERVFVTTIQSSPITETYRTLFEMAWRSGKRI